MKFNHLVKHNGIYYPAGADVPTEETKKSEGVKAPAPLVSGEVDEKPVASRKFTEEELSLPYMKLKALAKKEGLKVESNAKANEIKEMLRAL